MCRLASLFPHQEVVVEAVANGFTRLLLADEMGVGKTRAAIAAVESVGAFPALVTCPPALVENWRREWGEVEPLRTVEVVRSGGSWDRPAKEVTIVADSLLTALEDGLSAAPWGAMLIDEAHRMKGDSQRSRAALRISAQSPAKAVRMMLTGTPVMNRPEELMTLLNILGVLDTVFGGWKSFARRYLGPDGSVMNADELRGLLLSSVMIRRLRSEVLTLPAKGRTVVRCSLGASDEAVYRATEQELWGHSGTHAAGMVLLNRLRQVAGIGKVPATVDTVTSALEGGDQVLVFGWHRAVISALADALSPEDRMVVTGETTGRDRQRAIDAFQGHQCPVLIANLETLGAGVTLTAGRIVVMHELGWTPASLHQAEDRVCRIGQTREVVSNIMLADAHGPTVDDRVWQIVQGKATMIDALLRGTTSTITKAQTLVLDQYRKEQI